MTGLLAPHHPNIALRLSASFIIVPVATQLALAGVWTWVLLNCCNNGFCMPSNSKLVEPELAGVVAWANVGGKQETPVTVDIHHEAGAQSQLLEGTVHTYLSQFASYGGHRLRWIRALWCYMLTCLLSNPAKGFTRVTSVYGQSWQIFTACIEKYSFMLILCYPNVRPWLCLAEGRSTCRLFDAFYPNEVVKHC